MKEATNILIAILSVFGFFAICAVIFGFVSDCIEKTQKKKYPKEAIKNIIDKVEFVKMNLEDIEKDLKTIQSKVDKKQLQ